MDSLGLTINQSKLVLAPYTRIVFFGLILCSISITIKITAEKCQDIISLCEQFLNTKITTILTFVKLIGKLIAAEPGVRHAPLRINNLISIVVIVCMGMAIWLICMQLYLRLYDKKGKEKINVSFKEKARGFQFGFMWPPCKWIVDPLFYTIK